MTKINFTTKLLDEKWEHINEGPYMTLRSVCCLVLFGHIKGDENLLGDKKGELAFLGLRIQHKDELELPAEQIAMLKDRIGRGCPSVIILQAHRLLEGKSQLPSSEELD